MIRCIEDLKRPPRVGTKYKVPCVFGKIANIGPHSIPPDWWPVLRPSHQDSKYAPRHRTVWKKTDCGYDGVDEVYYEDDPTTPHHMHVDPRFTPESMYTPWEIHNRSWHSTIVAESDLEWRVLVCVRKMPIQRLFTGFGQLFIEDHKDKFIKCGRCPHKGTLLTSCPSERGVVTCPAHGLRFNKKTGACLTT
jgi:nitrite reductase/ring-hydroxylating ferredoxin subunit